MRSAGLLLSFLGLVPPGVALATHDGPDPLAAWDLTGSQVVGSRLEARLGPAGRIEGTLRPVRQEDFEALHFDGASRVVLADDLGAVRRILPSRHLTVEAWVAVERPQAWGAVLGVVQDNGNAEAGWVVGHDDRVFTFGLASTGADDGDGRMTYLKGSTPFETGRLHHVVATYDGQEMRLFVDGRLDASTRDQSGDLLYPAAAPVTLGAYADQDEDHRFGGRIASVALYDLCAGEAWVSESFEHGRALRALPPWYADAETFELVLGPYLQFGTGTGMTVMWETTRHATTRVAWGDRVLGTEEEPPRFERATEGEPGRIHEVRIEGLEPGGVYYYRVESTDAAGNLLQGPVRSFQTAVPPGTPVSFAVMSDTQGNPEVSLRLANLAWAQRPQFLVHAGDLVSTGKDLSHWTQHFFPGMGELIQRVPFYPVLGNHEQDARFYYDYVSLPAPEFHYEFTWGDVHFLMLDSNREVGPGSRQYAWLEERLAASTSLWKVVAFHHPPFSSDENDYGDRWRGPGTAGDLRTRELVPLFDRHRVDLVWNGHIHSYERTWPLVDGRPVDEGGTTYLVTGGGGGGLETAGPVRPPFQNNVRHGHHYCMVAVNGRTLEFKAFGLDGELFDLTRIEKRDR